MLLAMSSITQKLCGCLCTAYTPYYEDKWWRVHKLEEKNRDAGGEICEPNRASITPSQTPDSSAWC
jgi:hypothetical protein